MFAKKQQLYWLPILLLCCWETRFRIQLAPGRQDGCHIRKFHLLVNCRPNTSPKGSQNCQRKISLKNVTASKHKLKYW